MRKGLQQSIQGRKDRNAVRNQWKVALMDARIESVQVGTSVGILLLSCTSQAFSGCLGRPTGKREPFFFGIVSQLQK